MAQYQQARVQQDFLVHTPAQSSGKLDSDEAIATAVWKTIKAFCNIPYDANFYNSSSAFQDTCILLYCIIHSPSIIPVTNDFNRDYESQLIVVAREVDRVSANASVETFNFDVEASDVPDIVRQRLAISSTKAIAVSHNAIEGIARLLSKYRPRPVQPSRTYQRNTRAIEYTPSRTTNYSPPSQSNSSSGGDGFCYVIIGIVFLFIPFLFWIGICCIIIGFMNM